jgi:hypothetical protein
MNNPIDSETEKMPDHQKYMGDKGDLLDFQIKGAEQLPDLKDTLKALEAIHFNFQMEGLMYQKAAENALERILINLGEQLIKSNTLQSVQWTLGYNAHNKFELEAKKIPSEWENIVSMFPDHIMIQTNGPKIGRVMVCQRAGRLHADSHYSEDIKLFIEKTGIKPKISESFTYETSRLTNKLNTFQNLISLGEVENNE